MMKKSPPISTDTARDIAISALTFLTVDEARLSRFLDVTGWTPATLVSPESRETILITALDHLMGAEDLLLTFAAAHGLDPEDVALAHRAVQGIGGFAGDTGG
ncbi:MAG TPA: DUF3572 family protein [Rhizobiales bacterium]|nr:hypothetical protein BMS3Bbin10_02626 [bacterium BMS3Bbin10]HDO52971.1 DUF3572 family protein [Hyphomicrobiales bacterium]